jgi:uncharacterized cofD-like protein
VAGPLRAVVFDLDDTLYDCTGTLVGASRRRAAQVLVKAGLPMGVDEVLALQQELSARHGQQFPVFNEIAHRYHLDEDVIDEAYRAYNSDEVSEIAPFPDVKPTLKFLRSQGILCFLLTSGLHRRQTTKVRKLGLRNAFDEVVINDTERGELMGESLRYLLGAHRLRPEEVLVVGDRPPEEVRVGNDLGTATAQMLHGRFATFEPRDAAEKPLYRITRIFQVPTLLKLANLGKPPQALRIVALGGGTGLPIVLEGCKTYCSNLTAIVTVTDCGRSSGRLRQELGILPPGDARNCLIALSQPGEKERLLNQLFQYRFDHGSFTGMSLGNLAIAAMIDMEGSFERGVRVLSDLLNIRGRVLPPTTANCDLCAELEDGSVREGEVAVRELDKPPIRRAYLKPEAPPPCNEAVEAILAADIVVIGPGSLFTSVIPNILVPGIREALAKTTARKIYVSNIVTQPGQTDGFTSTDHLRNIVRYTGKGVIDHAVFNCHVPGEDILERYRAEGARIVVAEPALKDMGVDIVEGDLLEDLDGKRVLWEKQDLLRHHPDKLADILCRIYAGLPPLTPESVGDGQ